MDIINKKLNISLNPEEILRIAIALWWSPKISERFEVEEEYQVTEAYIDINGLEKTRTVNKTRMVSKTRDIENPVTSEQCFDSAIEDAIKKVLKLGREGEIDIAISDARSQAENLIDNEVKDKISFEGKK